GEQMIHARLIGAEFHARVVVADDVARVTSARHRLGQADPRVFMVGDANTVERGQPLPDPVQHANCWRKILRVIVHAHDSHCGHGSSAILLIMSAGLGWNPATPERSYIEVFWGNQRTQSISRKAEARHPGNEAK